MAPRYRRVTVIGAGPSGLAATHALAAEKVFDTIRVFDRRDRVGGLWHYDPVPDIFPETTGVPPKQTPTPPATLPGFAPSATPDPRARSALYWNLDSNIGAESMPFTYAPFPVVNSPVSIERFGHANPTRPYGVITDWIEDLFRPYLSLVSLSTTVEKVEKKGEEWVLTLRKAGQLYRGQVHDYWWTETFDAVVLASGHYHVPYVPDIPGLIETAAQFPGRFEHSKSYRKADKYADKRALVVGGGISATDFIQDLHAIARGTLEVSVRSRNPGIEAVFNLPNVRVHPTVKSIAASADGQTIEATLDDGTHLTDLDYVLFATGYRLQYPYLTPNPTTPENRVAGFYQHVFNIDDPSLTLVGQVKAALTFRVYEYQAVAVARYYAGRSNLPSPEDQKAWEADRLAVTGPTSAFHAIAPNVGLYFNWFVDFAGPPAPGTDSYALPVWQEEWQQQGLAIMGLKSKYWKELTARHEATKEKL